MYGSKYRCLRINAHIPSNKVYGHFKNYFSDWYYLCLIYSFLVMAWQISHWQSLLNFSWCLSVEEKPVILKSFWLNTNLFHEDIIIYGTAEVL